MAGAVVVVSRHCCGEVCLVISAAAAEAAGARAVAGAAAVLAAVAVVVVLVEALVVVEILVAVVREAAGDADFFGSSKSDFRGAD